VKVFCAMAAPVVRIKHISAIIVFFINKVYLIN
jgi:hypothetical protein